MIRVNLLLLLLTSAAWAAPLCEMHANVVADSVQSLLKAPRTVRLAQLAEEVAMELPLEAAALAQLVMLNDKKIVGLRGTAQINGLRGNNTEERAAHKEADVLKIQRDLAAARLKTLIEATLKAKAGVLGGTIVTVNSNFTSLTICTPGENNLGVCAYLHLRLRKVMYEVLYGYDPGQADVIATTTPGQFLSEARKSQDFHNHVLFGYEAWLRNHALQQCLNPSCLVPEQPVRCSLEDNF